MYEDIGDQSAAMLPPQQPQMSREGFAALGNVPGVLVRQKMHLLEEFFSIFERRNSYKISAIPPNLGRDNPTDIEFQALPSYLEAREQSHWLCRFCCANKRSFTIGFFPGGTPEKPQYPISQAPMMSIHRPFKCSILCCCCMLWPQELSVMSAERKHLGKVVYDFRCFEVCFKCNLWAKGFGPDGQHKYSFKAPLCLDGNCFAPSCCNDTYKVSIRDANNERNILSYIKNVWPGWNFRGLCSANADNYVVDFPEGTSGEDKALVMAGLFYHDFILFERPAGSED